MAIRSHNPNHTESPSFDRRAFLKLGTMGAALPLNSSAERATGSRRISSKSGQPAEAQREVLPVIPKPADLASDRLVHHFRDLFNPPAAQNEWGYLQATKTVSGITAISFPPFICCGTATIPFSPGDLQTCELYLNGQILASYPYPAGA